MEGILSNAGKWSWSHWNRSHPTTDYWRESTIAEDSDNITQMHKNMIPSSIQLLQTMLGSALPFLLSILQNVIYNWHSMQFILIYDRHLASFLSQSQIWGVFFFCTFATFVDVHVWCRCISWWLFNHPTHFLPTLVQNLHSAVTEYDDIWHTTMEGSCVSQWPMGYRGT